MAISANAEIIEAQRKATCTIWIGIGYEDADTDQTATEILVNNAKRDAYCAGIK